MVICDILFGCILRERSKYISILTTLNFTTKNLIIIMFIFFCCSLTGRCRRDCEDFLWTKQTDSTQEEKLA